MGIFAKDKPEAAASNAAHSDSDTAFFGAKLTIKGKVTGSGNLIVMGRLEGEVDLAGELVVAAPAVLSGEIRAVTLAVSGSVTGTLTAGEKIHLEKSAVVNGRMNTPRLSMADGAMFKGEIEMKKAADGGALKGEIGMKRPADGATFKGETGMKKLANGSGPPKHADKK